VRPDPFAAVAVRTSALASGTEILKPETSYVTVANAIVPSGLTCLLPAAE
jgi:hypothetical protein